MKTILIADDEPLARQVFRTLIERNFNDIEVVAEAENGRQAYELTCKLHPDIIAMDIKMPGLNGIDASRAILKVIPEAQIIVLTAYDSFDYIREAFELGVRGYLLKPIKVEQLVEKINLISRSVAHARQENDRCLQLENSLAAAQSIVERELVSAYVNGTETVENLEHFQSFLQLSVNAGFFLAVLLEPSPTSSINDNIRFDILKSKARAIAADTMQLMGKALVGGFIGNLLPIFVPLGENSNTAFTRKESALIAHETVRKLSGQLSVGCCAAIGQIYSGAKDFHRSYSEAVSLLGTLVPGEVFAFSAEKEVHFTYPYSLETELLDQILIGDTSKAAQTAARISNEVFTSGCAFDDGKDCFIELFVMLKRQIAGLGIDLRQLNADIRISRLETIGQWEELHAYIDRSIELIVSALNQKNANHNIALVQKIQRCLTEENIATMSLESLSGRLNLSSQYVSKMFKEEFGTNFIDYLTNYKIERAKLLLRSEQKSVGEVALCVGYSDPNYFCRIFKRITGVTPKEFKKLT